MYFIGTTPTTGWTSPQFRNPFLQSSKGFLTEGEKNQPADSKVKYIAQATIIKLKMDPNRFLCNHQKG